jgi:AcrR family transcriptional regulator
VTSDVDLTVGTLCYRLRRPQLRGQYVDIAAVLPRLSELWAPGAADGDNRGMQATDQPLGLRERKKLKTRQAIRREAFRLIDENGYASTTVEQIAEAAEVSQSTFFRYFPSKETLLLEYDLDPLVLAAFKEQPRDLSLTQAFRRAYEVTLANLSDEQIEFENMRQRLIFSIPELRGALYDEYHRTVGVAAEAIGHRIQRSADDFEVRVFAGALVGAMMATLGDGTGTNDLASQNTDKITRALDFVDAGMPLG